MIQEEDMRREHGDGPALDGSVEAEARQLLAAAFETAPAWALPTDGLVRKRVRHERRMRVLVPAGAFALAAAVAGGITAGAPAGSGETTPPSALQVLTAAVTKTWTQSYEFTATSGDRPKHGSGGVTLQGTLTGQFDPATGNGWERVRSTFFGHRFPLEFRYVDGHVYASTHGKVAQKSPPTTGGAVTGPPEKAVPGKAWQESLPVLPQSPNAWPGTVTTGFNQGQPFNPADLLALLKKSTSVRAAGPVSGPGWTGTKYTFTETINIGGNIYLSGSVSVDSAGRVRQLVTVSDNPISPTEGITTITFGGFGAPVNVTAPPASQVDNLGNERIDYMIIGF